VDQKGRVFDTVPFDTAKNESVESGLVLFESVSGGWGYANTQGETVIPPIFDAALPFRENKAAVKRNERWWYIAQPQF
jgi:hypothetical protein